MKILIALCAILAVSAARVVITAEGPSDVHLLGGEECTWGPSYWCENIKTAAGCNATKHCINAVWKDMEVPEDTDTVCGVCKDVVNQARDQLESNQTVDDLRAVFEGSCRLIRIKVIVKECITIVNQFIPDLVETLASEMNPSVVCSIAGLCNSPRIDKLLQDYEHNKPELDAINSRSLEKDELEPDECSKCYTVAKHMEYKLSNTPRDKMLRQMLNLCAELGSFTDACSATVLTYFETIRTHLKENFNAENICHLSGQCSAKFHKHEDTDTTPKVEIRPLSSVGMVDVSDDLPCKLCEQLVGHLRDLLVANTTEAEFQQVLKGLCQQTHSFASECTAVVDEYYPEIYEYLTRRLNSNAVCQLSGICPAPEKAVQNEPIWPLVPNDAAEIGMRIFQDAKNDLKNNKEEELSESEVEAMQLPIERMLPFPLSDGPVEGNESCAACEYVLHFIQNAITNPINVEKVELALHDICEKLPKSVQAECTGFVDTYGGVVVAILAQEIDPSQVCTMLHLCPTERLTQVFDSVPAKYMLENEKSKPGCPLCLLAVSQIYSVIKNNKTEANIEAELDKLCLHLPRDLKDQCTDLVKGYSKELIALLLADLTPQEVCAYLKLCDSSKNLGPKSAVPADKDGEILTNEIPDPAISPEVSIETEKSPTCVVCEFAMHYVDKTLGSDKEKHKIENAVRGVCNHLPKTISRECNHFVDKYADTIIDLLTKNISPKQVCTMIGMCLLYTEELKANVVECGLCKSVISVIENLLADPKVDDSIKNVVSKACKHLPAKLQNKCVSMINIYGQSIINLVQQHTHGKTICGKIGLCAPADYSMVSFEESSRIKRSYEKDPTKRCTWGPAYWCSTTAAAVECKAVEHCREVVWKADFAPPKQNA